MTGDIAVVIEGSFFIHTKFNLSAIVFTTDIRGVNTKFVEEKIMGSAIA